jgi:uncharacterized membrane protein YeiB
VTAVAAIVESREDLIDALRGAALLGILLVNIQSFAWGIMAPSMGVLWDCLLYTSDAADDM